MSKETKNLLARKLETKGKSDSYVISRTVIIAVVLLVIFVIAVFIKPKAVTEFVSGSNDRMLIIICLITVVLGTILEKKDNIFGV